MKQQVAILYGWAEGPWQGKALRAALHKAGFSVTTKADQADAIIAHSGGCFMLPKQTKAKKILLIGLPYWPSKSLHLSIREKLAAEIKNFAFVKKLLYHTLCIVTHPVRWFRMWQAWRRFAIPTGGEDTEILAIRNESDPFLHPTDGELLAANNGWHYKVISGHHDDLWTNPKPYIEHLKLTA